MRRQLFLCIVDAVEAHNPPYFKQKYDCCGKKGLFALQKCVAALRILAYGLPANAIDEYVCIGESTGRESLQHFCSNNDINALQRSPVFSSYLKGQSTPVEFEVNGHTYNMGYYLADGIYPEWPAFVKSIHHPMDTKTQHFSRRQESARKDIERAFGVLRARFAVVRGPAYGWYPKQVKKIMLCCIILHNMIVEDEGVQARNTNFSDIAYIPPVYHNNPDREAFVARQNQLKNRNEHFLTPT
ncbi:hypothetical protein U9M48_019463 [Paspalum notatum var. saurae]|uniref:DDE Tnp4 domain-containing protein n=1 Tax=Paspalum notatum var. saurae TaxID=547442 RepID=A0AAQ3WQZ2_PASNO